MSKLFPRLLDFNISAGGLAAGTVQKYSIRFLLVAILGITLLPIALIGSVNGIVAWKTDDIEHRKRFEALLTEQAASRLAAVNRLSLVMEIIANQPSIQQGSLPACSSALEGLLGSVSTLSNVRIVDRSGIVRCAARALRPNESVADAMWYQQLADFDKPLVIVAPSSLEPDKKAILYVEPITKGRFEGGRFIMELPSEKVQFRLKQEAFEDKASLHLINRLGMILGSARPPLAKVDSEDSANMEPIDDPLVDSPQLLVEMLGKLRATGQKILVDTITYEGIDFYLGVAEVMPDATYVSISRPIPVERVTREVDFITQIFIPLSMWVLALGASWFIIDRLVLRWMRRLQWQANWYAAGQFRRSVDMDGAPVEFRAVRETLSNMANMIGDKTVELERSLYQKELLVREIHHRVKNNLQIITSLLSLQASSMDDDASRRTLYDAQTRINALATIHQALYEVEDVRKVMLRPFFARLCRQLEPMGNGSGLRVSIRSNVCDAEADADRAIPLALLTTEAITNAIKHAFVDRERGTITVTIEPAASEAGKPLPSLRKFDITISDDGVGNGGEAASGTVRKAGGSGLGTTLMSGFARQLQTTVETHRGPEGSVITLSGAVLIEGSGRD